MVLGSGVTCLDGFGFAPLLRNAAEDMRAAGSREGALYAYKALAENVGRAAEPYIVPQLGLILDRCAAAQPASDTACMPMAYTPHSLHTACHVLVH